MEPNNLEVIELICHRLADGPEGPVGYVGKCRDCKSTVAISPESYKAFKSYEGRHVLVCLPCLLAAHPHRLLDIQPPTPGQLAEVREALQTRIRNN